LLFRRDWLLVGQYIAATSLSQSYERPLQLWRIFALNSPSLQLRRGRGTLAIDAEQLLQSEFINPMLLLRTEMLPSGPAVSFELSLLI
jgi:hypothetical protein